MVFLFKFLWAKYPGHRWPDEVLSCRTWRHSPNHELYEIHGQPLDSQAHPQLQYGRSPEAESEKDLETLPARRSVSSCQTFLSKSGQIWGLVGPWWSFNMCTCIYTYYIILYIVYIYIIYIIYHTTEYISSCKATEDELVAAGRPVGKTDDVPQVALRLRLLPSEGFTNRSTCYPMTITSK